MTSYIKKNKFILSTLVLTIVLAGMTFGNLPGPETTLGSQTIDNVVYNFADYPSLNHEQIALFNYMRGLITTEADATTSNYWTPISFLLDPSVRTSMVHSDVENHA